MNRSYHYEIWYNDSVADGYFKRAEEMSFRKVLEFDREDSTFLRLEEIFRLMNVVDGRETPVLLGLRSMSVGDIVVRSRGVLRVGFICKPAGWWRVYQNGNGLWREIEPVQDEQELIGVRATEDDPNT